MRTKFSRWGIDACPASFRAIISAVVYHDGCFRRWISARRTVNTADTSFVRINNIAEIGINGAPLWPFFDELNGMSRNRINYPLARLFVCLSECIFKSVYLRLYRLGNRYGNIGSVCGERVFIDLDPVRVKIFFFFFTGDEKLYFGNNGKCFVIRPRLLNKYSEFYIFHIASVES